MYGAVIQWLSWLPGGLMHANIGSCAIFAASSGSSVATAATVGTVAYPEMHKRGYNERLFLGSLAGIIPGLMLATLFMIIIIFSCWVRREWDGDAVDTTWGERIRTLPDLVPPILLFGVVVGSIYAGIATPTEAASVGVVFALMLAVWTRTLSITMLKEAFEGTMRTTAMIMIIILAAVFLNFVLGFIGVTQALLETVTELGLTPIETMILLVIFYLILGMFMETLSMLLTTVPIVFPIVVSMGFDPVWFGILVTVLMEAALITPPIGVNLYVVHGIRLKGGPFNDVAYGALPFVLMMIILVGLLIAFPDIALWLQCLVGSGQSTRRPGAKTPLQSDPEDMLQGACARRASCRSCSRASSACAARAPHSARNMSHWVSHTSPWVPRKASAEPPQSMAAHHSASS